MSPGAKEYPTIEDSNGQLYIRKRSNFQENFPMSFLKFEISVKIVRIDGVIQLGFLTLSFKFVAKILSLRRRVRNLKLLGSCRINKTNRLFYQIKTSHNE